MNCVRGIWDMPFPKLVPKAFKSSKYYSSDKCDRVLYNRNKIAEQQCSALTNSYSLLFTHFTTTVFEKLASIEILFIAVSISHKI